VHGGTAQTSIGTFPRNLRSIILKSEGDFAVVKFLLWCILLVLCWPIALLALIAFPFIWLLLLPFRILGIAVGGALALVTALIMLPARVLRGI